MGRGRLVIDSSAMAFFHNTFLPSTMIPGFQVIGDLVGLGAYAAMLLFMSLYSFPVVVVTHTFFFLSHALILTALA